MERGSGPLFCHNCNSRAVKPTSSEQMRKVRGELKLVADVVCSSCGHSWWSAHPIALEKARAMDKHRKDVHTSDPDV